MTTKNFVFLFAGVLFASCSTTQYYQVFDIQASTDVIQDENTLAYEDENCRISYDLWDGEEI